MTPSSVILRKWTGRIRTTEEREYVSYIAGTGLKDYAKTSGNLGFEMLLRDLGNGETEVTTLSWWTSMDAIRAFAGATPELARYYPQDDKYLVHRPLHVEHHRVVASELRVPSVDPE
jgi:heme-degrading monooxygenase HmoA